MDIKKLQKYWFDGYKDALLTAEKLYETKRYHHALFFGHLALEKILKAVVVKQTKEHAAVTHDLVKLARDTELEISPEILNDLAEINKFNIRARYDNYQLAFYKKATKEYAAKWISIIKQIALWLEQKLQHQ